MKTKVCLALLCCSAAWGCSGGGSGANGGEDAGGDTENDASTDTDSGSSDTDDSDSSFADPVLYLGVMVHLEGHAVSQPNVYESYKQRIFDYADIFEQHDARLTLEVKEQIHACNANDDPFFADLEQRGHGVGVHADAGGVPGPGESWQDLSQTLAVLRSQLEEQQVSVRHVSGYCSPLDWPRAVHEAGYSFVTGGVAYCLMCLPDELIPEQFSDCQNPAECHEPYPTEMSERMHPWTIAVGEPWIEGDPNGELVYLPSTVEGLPYIAEKENDEDTSDVEFTSEDVEVYAQKLEEALALVDPERVNFFYAGWSFGKEMPDWFAHEWLEAIDPYVAEGRAEWKTLPEMYDIYVDWRDNR
jgi:hypothetical protein